MCGISTLYSCFSVFAFCVFLNRFVIKAVIDKASVGDIEEDGPEAINLLATVEHILNHHAKG